MKKLHTFFLILLLAVSGGIIFAFGQSICHSCFDSFWRTQTIAVRCDELPELVESLHSQGFQTQVFVYRREKLAVCDVLAYKHQNPE